MLKPKSEGLTFTRPVFGPNFLKEAYAELKRVRWPTRQETVRLTTIVIVASVAIGAYVGVLDLGFTKLMAIILSLK